MAEKEWCPRWLWEPRHRRLCQPRHSRQYNDAHGPQQPRDLILEFRRDNYRIEFHPGSPGASHEEGNISAVHDDGHATRSNVEQGWTPVSIDDKLYSDELLSELLGGCRKFYVTFRTQPMVHPRHLCSMMLPPCKPYTLKPIQTTRGNSQYVIRHRRTFVADHPITFVVPTILV